MSRTAQEERVLGIETSSMVCSVAGVGPGGAEAVWEEGADGAHGTHLLRGIDHVLGRLGWRLAELDRIAVGSGPGRFTGLRVGLATAAGLARAAGIPAVAVPSFEAWAAPARGRWASPLADARKGEVYAALFDPSGRKVLAETTAPPARWTRAAVERASGASVSFWGPGADLYRAAIEGAGGAAAAFPRDLPPFPPAAWVARGSVSRPTGAGLRPLYVRAPDAVLKGGSTTGSRVEARP